MHRTKRIPTIFSHWRFANRPKLQRESPPKLPAFWGAKEGRPDRAIHVARRTRRLPRRPRRPSRLRSSAQQFAIHVPSAPLRRGDPPPPEPQQAASHVAESHTFELAIHRIKKDRRAPRGAGFPPAIFRVPRVQPRRQD